MTSRESHYELLTKPVGRLHKNDRWRTVKISALDKSWTLVGTLNAFHKTIVSEIPWGAYLGPGTPHTIIEGYVVLEIGPFRTPQLDPRHPILVEQLVLEAREGTSEDLPLALETLARADARRAS